MCERRVAEHGIVRSDRFSQVDKGDIFLLAETQTSQMLADNLLAKFQDTDSYQRITEGLLAIASGDEETTVHSHADRKSMSREPRAPRGSARTSLARHSNKRTSLLGATEEEQD